MQLRSPALTRKQSKFIEICAHKIHHNQTYEGIAEELGVSVSTVKNALRWGRQHDIFRSDRADLLQRRIIEVRNMMRLLDERIEGIMKVAENTESATGHLRTLLPKDYIGLFKERRETTVLLLQLEGLYENVVNIVVGEVTQNVLMLPGQVDPSGWAEHVKKFTRDQGIALEEIKPKEAMMDWEKKAKRLLEAPVDDVQ